MLNTLLLLEAVVAVLVLVAEEVLEVLELVLVFRLQRVLITQSR
jgi:hypothetical protein